MSRKGTILSSQLIDKNVIYVHWNLANREREAERNAPSGTGETEPEMYIRIDCLNTNRKLASLKVQVFCIENRWHIYLPREFGGERIRISLVRIDDSGKEYILAHSEEIETPADPADIYGNLPDEKSRELHRLSGAGERSHSGSGENISS